MCNQGSSIATGGLDQVLDTSQGVPKDQYETFRGFYKSIYTWMGSQHTVEDCSILSFIQVCSFDCDHRRTTGLILEHTGVKHSFCKAWPIIVDIENRYQDLMCMNRQKMYKDKLEHRLFST